MATLDGERIEELLWETGLDFQHTVRVDEIPAIEVFVGESIILVSETWATEDGWFLDSDMAVLEKYVDDRVVSADFDRAVSEKDLVEKIMNLGGIHE